jgi:hypothetical protein
MNTNRSMPRALAVALALFSLSLAASAQTAARSRVERSAGWGTDLATGAVAVEASLLVLYDPATRTLVINPNFFNDAVAETQAVVLGDGSWRMPDGNVLRPLVGTEAIVLGDEPAGLLEASGLPAVAYDRVSLVDRVGIAAVDSTAMRTDGKSVLVQAPLQTGGYALKVKHSKRCAGCSDGCGFLGCYGGREEFIPVVFGRGRCEFKLFHRCREEFKPACRVDVHTCSPCLGPVISSWDSYDWYCTGGC